MKWISSLVMLFMFQTAFADQCEWNSLTDANSAVKLIKNNDIIFWCQNCNEAKPSSIFKVTNVRVKKEVSSGMPVGRIVNVQAEYLVDKNGTDLDLAYTYVRTASNIFTNIAHLVGCPSEGATTFIQTGPGVKKVAHYYDGQGVRQNITTSSSDLNKDEFKNLDKSRMPASVK
ncbi:MAG: hypothetical protein ACXVLQ_02015 [Bacteriovorax sp.]